LALESAFRSLCEQLQELRESLTALRLTVVEDRPLEGEAVLVDQFGDAAEDVLGWLEEAMATAGQGYTAACYPHDVGRAARALVAAHEQLHQITRRAAADLMAYERIDGLMKLGLQRKGEWLAWSGGVREALEKSQQSLDESSQTLLLCWREIVERVDSSTVALQSTNITQHLQRPGAGGAGRE
jgi:hypothetical protein